MSTSLRGNRDFLLLWSGQVVSTVGNRVANLAYPLLVLSLTGSPVQAGLVGLASALAAPVWYLPAGALVDRWNRKWAMMVADVARVGAVVSVVVALLVGRPSLVQLMLVAFIESTGGVFFQLAEAAALPQVVARRDLSAAVAQNQARDLGSGLAGQPLGGLLFGLGHAIPFLANAVSYLVSLCTLALIRPRLRAPVDRVPRRLTVDVAEGIAWLWRQPLLRDIALLSAIGNLAFGALPLILIVRARQLGAAPVTIGLMMGIAGGGAAIGALIAPKLQRRIPERLALLGAPWISCLLIAGLAVLPNAIGLGLVMALAIMQAPLGNVIAVGYRYALVPDRLLARVTSVSRLISFGTIPVASGIAGLVVAHLGPARAFVVTAGALGVGALLAMAMPTIRRAPSIQALSVPDDEHTESADAPSAEASQAR